MQPANKIPLPDRTKAIAAVTARLVKDPDKYPSRKEVKDLLGLTEKPYRNFLREYFNRQHDNFLKSCGWNEQYNPQLSEEGAFAAVVNVIRKLKKCPTAAEYEAFADPKPHRTTVQRKLRVSKWEEVPAKVRERFKDDPPRIT
jgi:hypothetical protein